MKSPLLFVIVMFLDPIAIAGNGKFCPGSEMSFDVSVYSNSTESDAVGPPRYELTHIERKLYKNARDGHAGEKIDRLTVLFSSDPVIIQVSVRRLRDKCSDCDFRRLLAEEKQATVRLVEVDSGIVMASVSIGFSDVEWTRLGSPGPTDNEVDSELRLNNNDIMLTRKVILDSSSKLKSGVLYRIDRRADDKRSLSSECNRAVYFGPPTNHLVILDNTVPEYQSLEQYVLARKAELRGDFNGAESLYRESFRLDENLEGRGIQYLHFLLRRGKHGLVNRLLDQIGMRIKLSSRPRLNKECDSIRKQANKGIMNK